ncbi:CDP-alcohol phosphatidyltransferase family protein [Streptococcus moroccensis]|uniref:CDP-diacylglycerol--serine O-phosphatidyltransferase n=1 Tax=Streptococcus moroccensis TaxID=1451356 RepID=A0ABT9YQW8_9STRE|nr:CDP-alcohol phosphatidyltransferase family protein [Streptococcus moroccensis]MDQ0222391.1 CDP-diacylglycerol--serine O-phosphatidyltransferase [Streptococcus moroccensis]
MWLGEYNKSVLLTYLGVVFALLAIGAVINDQLALAMMAFVISGICDLFDGVVARRMTRTKAQEQFGVEIDSLCDMINFAALPAILLMTQVPISGLNVVLAVLYSLAAVTRLAHFNRLTKGEEGSTTHFVGVPVTYGALAFPLSYWLCEIFLKGSSGYVWMLLGPLMSLLFIWNHPIPKPNKKAYIVFVVLALVTLLGLSLML